MLLAAPALVFAGLCTAMPALAEVGRDDLSAYVSARAADADGNAAAAASGYARALDAVPGDAVVAVRAYRAAIEAGDYALITRARAVLDTADVSPSDAVLLALAEAVHDSDDAAVAAAIKRLSAGPLGFLSKSLEAWRLLPRDPRAAFAVLDSTRGDSLARGIANENRGLMLIARGDATRGLAEIKGLRNTAHDSRDIAIDAAYLLAATGSADADADAAGPSPTNDAAPVPRDTVLRGDALAAFGIGRLLSRFGVALLDMKSGRLDLAVARAALRIDPHDDRARLVLAQALAMSRRPDAGLAALAPIDPTSGYFREAQVQRAGLLADLDQDAQAIAIAKSLAEGTDASVDDIRRYGDLLRGADRFDEAASVYRRLLVRPDAAADWISHVQLGDALASAGHWPLARAQYEAAVAIAPDMPVALNYLGYGLIEHGEQLPRAQRLLERAAALVPTDLAILDSLAWAYVQQGDAAKAVPLLEQAASGSPDNATISEHLGDAYWQVGRRFEARYAWRAAAVIATPADAGRLAAKIASGLNTVSGTSRR